MEIAVADGSAPVPARTMRKRSSPATSLRRAIFLQPASRSTKNRLFCKRPVEASRPRPQTQVVLLLRSRCGPAFAHASGGAGTARVVSDSLVDNRGCLSNRSERQAIPCYVHLQCRWPLNSSLNESFRERVLYIFLQRPA